MSTSSFEPQSPSSPQSYIVRFATCETRPMLRYSVMLSPVKTPWPPFIGMLVLISGDPAEVDVRQRALRDDVPAGDRHRLDRRQRLSVVAEHNLRSDGEAPRHVVRARLVHLLVEDQEHDVVRPEGDRLRHVLEVRARVGLLPAHGRRDEVRGVHRGRRRAALELDVVREHVAAEVVPDDLQLPAHRVREGAERRPLHREEELRARAAGHLTVHRLRR